MFFKSFFFNFVPRRFILLYYFYSIWSLFFLLLFFMFYHFLDLFSFFNFITHHFISFNFFNPVLVLILLIVIFLSFFKKFVLVFNLVPHCYLSLSFYTRFGPHYFDCYLFCFIYNFEWIGIFLVIFNVCLLWGDLNLIIKVTSFRD